MEERIKRENTVDEDIGSTFFLYVMTQNDPGGQNFVNIENINNDANENVLLHNTQNGTEQVEYQQDIETVEDESINVLNLDIQAQLLESFKEIIYRCKKCLFTSKDENKFKCHVLYHVVELQKQKDQSLYLCSLCDMKFESLKDVRQHIKTDHSSGKGCDVDIKVVVNDEENENGEEKIKEEEFDGMEYEGALQRLPVNPPKTMNVVIQTNKKKKTTKIRIKRKKNEILKSLGPSINCVYNLKCSISGSSVKLANKEDLNIHQKCHVINSENGENINNKSKFCCCMCNEVLTTWRSCSLHLLKFHQIECGLFVCPTCKEYKTPMLIRLENHMRIHSDLKAFKCRHCDKSFKQSTQLRNHNATHVDSDKQNVPKWYDPQQCNICFKMYSDSKCLKKHIEEVHIKLKPYVCNVCGHAAARKSTLQLHFRQHSGQKPFQCTLCDYKTADHNSFRKHFMRHTGARPYKCPHCHYTAIQSCSLKSHLKIAHPKCDGIYSCELCTYVTVSEDNYVRHVSDHMTGVITVVGEDNNNDPNSGDAYRNDLEMSAGENNNDPNSDDSDRNDLKVLAGEKNNDPNCDNANRNYLESKDIVINELTDLNLQASEENKKISFDYIDINNPVLDKIFASSEDDFMTDQGGITYSA